MTQRYSLEGTARKMATSLIAQAEQAEVDLTGLTIDNYNEFLDDLFNDGGEVRCEYFGDLAIPYALEFGKLESPEFDKARWPCFERAIEIVNGRIE